MEIIARKVVENGEEIIELDLNKPWPKDHTGYSSYMDDIEGLSAKPRKAKKEFICVIE